MKQIKLKPCPFCGSNEVHIEAKMDERFTGSPLEIWVTCGCCYARSQSTFYNPESAMNEVRERWNRRIDIIESPTECEHLMEPVCIEDCDYLICYHPVKAKCIKPGCDFEGEPSVPARPNHFREVAEKVEEKPPLKLRVGGVYRNRLGNKVFITSYEETDIYPFKANLYYQNISNFARSFTEDGRCIIKRESAEDLIEEVQPEQNSIINVM